MFFWEKDLIPAMAVLVNKTLRSQQWEAGLAELKGLYDVNTENIINWQWDTNLHWDNCI
jgi:hypothetical protein